MPERVLVIGGTGFVGSRVVRRLAGAGHDLAVVHRSPAVLPAGARSVRLDRTDLTAESAPFEPDVILDVVPYVEADARRVVEAFRGRAGRAVALSSGDVYRNYDGFRGRPTAPPDPVPLAEDAPLREARFPYRGLGLEAPWADDYDKVLVEDAYRSASDLPTTLLRLPAVFGEGDPQRRVASVLEGLEADGPVRLGGTQAGWRWSRAYVEDVAAAVALVVADDRAVGETLNLGDRGALTEAEWTRAVAEAAGLEARIMICADEGPFDFRYDLALDTSRARGLGLGAQVGLREGLARTVAAIRGAAGA